MTEPASWPAVVLTAGLATRLRPLSDVRAKAAMPVAGTSIIVRILTWLRAAGVRDVVLNLHHRAETITGLVGDGSRWDLRVRYSWEPRILGSAGGPRRAMALVDADRCFIVNGDTLTNCDLRAVARRHVASKAQITMAVVPGDVARYGGVLVAPDGTVTGFARSTRSAPVHLRTALAAPVHPRTAPAAPAAPVHRTAPVAPSAPDAPVHPAFHFVGVQAVEASAFADVPDDEASETVRTWYPRFIAAAPGSVVAYHSDAEFFDVGTPRDYLDTVRALASREGRPFDCGADADIAPDARLSETIIWDQVRVGRRAHLSRCIVGDGVRIEDNARYEDRVLVVTGEGMRDTPF